jgi:hypothetical protein
MKKLIRITKKLIDKHSMIFCEKINFHKVLNQINYYSKYINDTTEDTYKRNLMKAITFEEQIHQYPFQTIIEDNIPFKLANYLDIADSVGPGQIRVSLWAKKYETNRQELINPKTHFVVMNSHIDFIILNLEDQKLPITPEWIGTLWLNMNADKINRYGQRVLKFYNYYSKR